MHLIRNVVYSYGKFDSHLFLIVRVILVAVNKNGGTSLQKVLKIFAKISIAMFPQINGRMQFIWRTSWSSWDRCMLKNISWIEVITIYFYVKTIQYCKFRVSLYIVNCAGSIWSWDVYQNSEVLVTSEVRLDISDWSIVNNVSKVVLLVSVNALIFNFSRTIRKNNNELRQENGKGEI